MSRPFSRKIAGSKARGVYQKCQSIVFYQLNVTAVGVMYVSFWDGFLSSVRLMINHYNLETRLVAAYMALQMMEGLSV